jgi:hypothetical protein
MQQAIFKIKTSESPESLYQFSAIPRGVTAASQMDDNQVINSLAAGKPQ